jgi:hypothetical protein
MKISNRFHLTYCSNIHPGETWAEVRRNLETYLPEVRQQLAVDGPFGIGLRLSAAAAEVLEQPDQLREFQEFLCSGNYYVFTINGFPYGMFHGTRVKENVYLPDWMEIRRLEYTNRLAGILAALLPEDPDLEGSVSTAPGAFKERVRSEIDVRRMAESMLSHAMELVSIRKQTGKTIGLAIEAEPCCHMETIDEVRDFFSNYLFNPDIIEAVTQKEGRSLSLHDVRRHVGVCFDACHMAVEYEDPADALRRLKEAGIRILKFQISAALQFRHRVGDGEPEKKLTPFAESTYLHQVVQKGASGFVRFTDLPDALAAEGQGTDRPGGISALEAAEEREWRIHFHIPIFLNEMEGFGTTQGYLASLVELIKRDKACPYLEVETYTWDVLPAEYKTVNTATAVARELLWIRERLER